MASDSDVVVLDVVAEEVDTATSSFFFADEGAATLSWPAAERTRSTLTTATLRSLCENAYYGIPKEYEAHLAEDKDVACTPCPPGTICVYADALDAGLRFPLHGFHAALLRHYGLAPSQLAPSAWRYVAAFVLLCGDAGVEPAPSVFQHFFNVCTHKGDAAGWHHFSGGGRPALFTGRMSTSVYAGWKSRFFFLRAPSNAPWQCPVRWGRPSRKAVRKPQMTSATQAAVERLLEWVAMSGTDDIGWFLLAGRRLPVGPEHQAGVKREPAGGIDQQKTSRKRCRSPDEQEPASATPGRAGCDSPPPGFASAKAASASKKLMSQLAQTLDAEINGKEEKIQALKKELQEAKDENAQHQEELRVERNAHAVQLVLLRADKDLQASKALRLGMELQMERTEASQLKEELQTTKAEASRLAEVALREKELPETRHEDEHARLPEELRAERDARADDATQLALLRAKKYLHKSKATRLTVELQMEKAEARQLREQVHKAAAEASQVRGELHEVRDGVSRLAEELWNADSAATARALAIQLQRELTTSVFVPPQHPDDNDDGNDDDDLGLSIQPPVEEDQ